MKGADADALAEADALVHLGRARYKSAAFADAAALFSQALGCCDQSDRPAAAYGPTSSAGALAATGVCGSGARPRRTSMPRCPSRANSAMSVSWPIPLPASLLAERTGQTVMAAGLAEQAKELYERLGDRRSLARILNNLGGLNWLLGRTAVAFQLLRDAFAIATEVDSATDAAQAISSLAQVLLGDGQPDQAEAAARHAIELLDGREDYLEEIGNATLVLARSLVEQERHEEALEAVLAAEALFTKVSATSALAAALLVRGDIRRAGGEVDEAADLYRRAADLLHDHRF